MSRLLVPTPLHGWRAFWGEVGIIVLGVLIALGAQQAVEEWSDRERADRALDAIRTEMAENDRGFRIFMVTAPCIYAQIDRIVQEIAARRSDPLTLHSDADGPRFVIRTPSYAFTSNSWEAIDGIDTMRLLDPDFVAIAASYFGRMENLRHFNREAVALKASLNALGHVMPTDDSDRLRMIETLERLREAFYRIRLNAGQLRDIQAQSGLVLPDRMAIPDSRVSEFCRAQGLPLATLD